MNWSEQRVLVTGGTGFIGTHLCKKLTSLGANIAAVVHKRPYTAGYALQILADLTDRNSGFGNLVKMFSPTVVFHLAAQPIVGVAAKNAYDTLETNVRGTYNLLDVCRDLKSINTFVHISTDKVYGNVTPISRYTIPAGVEHPYNASKLASDVLAQMYSKFYDIPMVVIRNANVYGAGDKHFDRLIPNVIAKVLCGRQPVIRGDGRNTRDFVHVDDIVNGYIRAAEVQHTSNSVLNVLNLSGHNHSILEVVDCILFKMNRIDLAPVYERMWAGEIPHQNIVNDFAKQFIDWNPATALNEGLDKTIPWYREDAECELKDDNGKD